MAINLSDNVHVSAPKPVESKYLNVTNTYSGTSQVNSCIPSGERYLGLTVNISNVEYWYSGGILDSCLVTKSAGGTWGSITGTLSSQNDLQTCLNSKLASGGTAVCATSAIDSKSLCGCIPNCFLGATTCAIDSAKLGNHLPSYYLNSGSTITCAADSAKLNNKLPIYYLNTSSTAICATSAIDSKALCGCVPTCFLGTTACAADSAKLGNHLPAYYLNTGSTAICATSAINSLALCGCVPSCFLGATACATDSNKLNNHIASYYLNTGSTAICATSAIDSKGLCGCTPSCFLGVTATASDSLKLGGILPAGYLLSGGTAKNSTCLNGQLASFYLSTTACAADSAKLNNKLPAYYLNTGSTSINSLALCGCIPSCFLGATACASDSAKLGNHLPAYYLNTGSTALCSTTAGNALCLGGSLAACYATKALAITGITSMGSGTTLVHATSVANNKIQVKSVKACGTGLSIINDATTISISGSTTDIFTNVTDLNLLQRSGSTVVGYSLNNITTQQTRYSVTQASHGFVVGNIIKSSGANTYVKATGNTAANAEVVGIVIVKDTNTFTFVTHGVIETGVPTQTAGTVMFLSPTSGGTLTATEPVTTGQISKPLMVVLQSSSKALFQIFRGMIITADGSYAPLNSPAITGSGSWDTPTFAIDATNHRIGIGTSTPTVKIDVLGAETLVGADYASPTTRTNSTLKAGVLTTPHYTNACKNLLTIGALNDTATNEIIIGGGWSAYNAATSIEFYTAANNTTVTGTQRMIISCCGNVGIGSTCPATTLDVNGSVNISGAGLSAPPAGLAYGLFPHSGVGLGIYTAGSISFWTTGTPVERMRLTATGLGIGTSPSTKLHIAGNIRLGDPAQDVSNYSYLTTVASSVNTQRLILGTTYGYGVEVDAISMWNGTVTFPHLATGSLTSASGVITSSSDQTLKIADGLIDCALPKIMNLTPRYFYWNEKSGLDKCTQSIRQLGFYAQEVNKVLGEEVANTPEEGKDWGYYDRGVIAMLTKAMQELKTQNDSLIKRIDSIENKNM